MEDVRGAGIGTSDAAADAGAGVDALHSDGELISRRMGPRAFAELIGVSVSTLRRWDRSGRLVAGRYPSGRMFYTQEDYEACSRKGGRADGR